MDMQPLTKEEIDEMEQEAIVHGPWIVGVNTIAERYRRLLFTARLGAEFERVCTKDGTGEKPLDTEAKKV